MTNQVNLDLVWASAGGVTDPGDIKYEAGWISEIPTYQNFNFVLQNHSLNQLAAAERAALNWQIEIAYVKGAVVTMGDRTYYCHLANTGNSPEDDSTDSYWRLSESWGAAHTYSAKAGAVNNTMFPRGATNWLGQDQTIINTDNSFILFADNSIRTNILFGMSNGELVTKYVGNLVEPDGQNIHPDTDASRIFHEAHPPIQSEVAGTIPEAPNDSYIYGRGTNTWIQIAGVDGLKAFPTGTRMLFVQGAAPNGWVQDASDTANERMLRVVTAAGGGVGGTDDCILMNKVPLHVHRTFMNSASPHHTHGLTGNSGSNSVNHSHPISVTTGNNNKSHTHNQGSYTTNTTGQHTHIVGVKIKFDEDNTGFNGSTDSFGSNDLLYSGGEGAHKHTISGNSGGQSTNHTHSVSGTSSIQNANHTHSLNGMNTHSTGATHHHTGGVAATNINETINYDFSDQQNGTSGSYDQENSGNWEPKYINIIICTAN